VTSEGSVLSGPADDRLMFHSSVNGGRGKNNTILD